MAQLANFRPVDDYQRGKLNALAIQKREQGIERERQDAPIRNQLAKMGLEQVQSSEKRSSVQNEQSDAIQKMTILNQTVKALAGLPEGQRGQAFASLEPDLRKFGIETSEIKRAGFSDDMMRTAIAKTQALINDPKAIENLSSGQRERRDLINDLKGAIDPVTNKLIPEEKMTAMQRAAAIDLGLLARRGTITGQERIAGDQDLTQRVAKSQGQIAKGKETGKLSAELKYKPAIQAAVKAVEAEAKANAETFTSLKRANAALPGLTEVVEQLKALAPIATNTFGGRAFDSVVKELGFGGTKGATARAKFVSLINNQVLPLLRETFGAAFTAQEGESLKATMGDVNASAEEKIAQLNAFIEQKYRDIESKQHELNQSDLTEQEKAELEQLRQRKANQ